VTLRLKASFYHRFHAPCDATLRRVVYIAGDTWNVNPIALKRIEALFTKNERAVLEFDLGTPGQSLAIVAVAAILVASIRLHCLGTDVDLRKKGPNPIEVTARYRKGEELGWFQHGSTLLVFGTPGFALCPHLRTGERVRYGEALLRRPASTTTPAATSTTTSTSTPT
jgi:phosphatidylserine decarboxylase